MHATRQFYHCFGCGVSGDVFSFVQKIENITFPEAVRLVAQKLGIPLPKATYSSPAEASEAKLRAQLLDVHERAVRHSFRMPEASRGRTCPRISAGPWSDAETIARFRIGYAPDSGFLLRDRLAGEFGEEVLRESGLFSWKQERSSRRVSATRLVGTSPMSESTAEPGEPEAGRREAAQRRSTAAMYSKFRNRVMFPIANEPGKIIAFTGTHSRHRRKSRARNI